MGLGCLNPGRCKCLDCCDDYDANWNVAISGFQIDPTGLSGPQQATNQAIVDGINATSGPVTWASPTLLKDGLEFRLGYRDIHLGIQQPWGLDSGSMPRQYRISDLRIVVYAGCDRGQPVRHWTWAIWCVSSGLFSGFTIAGIDAYAEGGGGGPFGPSGILPISGANLPIYSGGLFESVGSCGMPPSPFGSTSFVTQISTPDWGLLSMFHNNALTNQVVVTKT